MSQTARVVLWFFIISAVGSIIGLPFSNSSLSPMTITSPAFPHNGTIPAKYSCESDNVNPPLDFFNIPPEAKSLALIMDDPDAPVGTWVHWVVWNMDPSIDKIAEASHPQNAKEGLGSSGKAGYQGPCPPSGTHHYHFKLYALDESLDLSLQSDKMELEEAMVGHVIAHAELIGLYTKEK